MKQLQISSAAPVIGLYLIVFALECHSTPESVSNLDQYDTGSDSSKEKITVYYPNSRSQDILVDDLREIGDYDKRANNWYGIHGLVGKRAPASGWDRLGPSWGKKDDSEWYRLNRLHGKRGGKRSFYVSWKFSPFIFLLQTVVKNLVITRKTT